MPRCSELGLKDVLFDTVILGRDVYEVNGQKKDFEALLSAYASDLRAAGTKDCKYSINASYQQDVGTDDFVVALRRLRTRFYVQLPKAELEKSGKVGVTANLEGEATQSPAVAATETKKEPDPPKQGSQTTAPVGTVAASAAGGVQISAGPGQNTGTIIVTSEPTGAQIYLDDSPAGIAPVTLKLKPGNHSIRAFKKGYQNWLRAVTLEAGQNLPLTVAMQKLN